MTHKRVDRNQNEIVKALREMRMSVFILSDVGHGCPDILVGAFGQNFLFELKDGKKSPSQRKLTLHEKKFHDTWKGQVQIINSLDEIFDFFEVVHHF